MTTALLQFFSITKSIDQAGPKLAGRLVGASGTLFSELAIIAVVLFAIKDMLFGDKGIKELIVFMLFLSFARGLLAGYNFFFVQGVVDFFAQLGRMVAGSNTPPMNEFYKLIGNIYGSIWNLTIGHKNTGFNPIASAINGLYAYMVTILATVILIVLAVVIIGTIVLVHVYIAIALVTGYIFVPFMIIKPLEFLWNGWFKFLIVSSLSYFMIYLLTALLSASITSITAMANGTTITVSAIFGILMLLMVFAYLFLKIPSIAGEIVSGMPNMSFSGVVSIAVGAASMAFAGGRIAGAAAKTLSQIKSRAKRGGEGK